MQFGPRKDRFVSGSGPIDYAQGTAVIEPPVRKTCQSASGPLMAIPILWPMGVGGRRSQVTLPGSPIALQDLILSDFADALGLLIPHLDDGDLVTVDDVDRNFVAPGLNFL